MPILPGHRAELTACQFADLKSTGAGRYGGACTAAAFLEFFIGLSKDGDAPDKESYKPAFLHIDIAGPGMVKGAATGFGTMAILEYIMASAPGQAHKQDDSAA